MSEQNAAPQAAFTLAEADVPESDREAKVSGEPAVAAPSCEGRVRRLVIQRKGEAMDSKQADRNALGDKIAALLKDYRLAHTQDDEGYGYQLVDMVTPPEQESITLGIEELENLADEIAWLVIPAETPRLERENAFLREQLAKTRDRLERDRLARNRVERDRLARNQLERNQFIKVLITMRGALVLNESQLTDNAIKAYEELKLPVVNDLAAKERK